MIDFKCQELNESILIVPILVQIITTLAYGLQKNMTEVNFRFRIRDNYNKFQRRDIKR